MNDGENAPAQAQETNTTSALDRLANFDVALDDLIAQKRKNKSKGQKNN